jgi:hypothetical protein
VEIEEARSPAPLSADVATGPGADGAAQVLPHQIAGSVLPVFVSPRGLTRLLVILFALCALVAWLAAGVHLADARLQYLRLGGVLVNSGHVATVTGLMRIAHGVQIAVFTATAIAFVCWLWRLRVNVRALGMRKLEYGRWWTLLGFLIPGLNVVRPYRVMSEIWRASDPAVLDAFEWKSLETPRLLFLWWGMVVLAVTLLLVAASLEISAGVSPFKELVADVIAALSDAAAAVSASVGFFVATRLSSVQIAKCHRLLGQTEPW